MPWRPRDPLRPHPCAPGGNDPGAPRSLSAHTTTGSVTLVGYTPPELVYLPECAAADGDPYAILVAAVDGDALELALEYSGGCAAHAFTLCWPEQAFRESEPVQAALELLHDDRGDACDALVSETRSFDLAPLRQAYVDGYPHRRVRIRTRAEDRASLRTWK